MLEKECCNVCEIRGPVVAGAQREEHGADGEEERGDDAGARAGTALRCQALAAMASALFRSAWFRKSLYCWYMKPCLDSEVPGTSRVSVPTSDMVLVLSACCDQRDCLFAVASR